MQLPGPAETSQSQQQRVSEDESIDVDREPTGSNRKSSDDSHCSPGEAPRLDEGPKSATQEPTTTIDLPITFDCKAAAMPSGSKHSSCLSHPAVTTSHDDVQVSMEDAFGAMRGFMPHDVDGVSFNGCA